LLSRLASRVLSATEPALQVSSVHDAEHQDHAVRVDDVVHQAVVVAARLLGVNGSGPASVEMLHRQ
jgi:hypothetical protein